MVGTLFFFLFGPLWFIAAGSMCNAVVDHEQQETGAAFVCWFVDSLVFAWTSCWTLVYTGLVRIRLHNSKRPLPYIGFGAPIYVWAPSTALMLALPFKWDHGPALAHCIL